MLIAASDVVTVSHCQAFVICGITTTGFMVGAGLLPLARWCGYTSTNDNRTDFAPSDVDGVQYGEFGRERNGRPKCGGVLHM